jgi:hypothetical protein
MMNAIIPYVQPLDVKARESNGDADIRTKIQKAVDFLFFKSSSLQGVYHKHLAEHVFIKCRPELFKGFAHAIQKILDRIDIHLMDKKSELYLSSVITLIPYCYPKRDDKFLIPFKNSHQKYERYTFTVTDIVSMSVDPSLSPMKAYGLKNELGHNMLIFLGTTFPSADGFLNALLTDFTPFLSVGKMAFSLSQSELKAYFKKHSDVIVYGKSLGGSLALHALREFEASIKEVHSVVPAGLHVWDKYQSICAKKVVIITHTGDLVSKMGYFPEHKNTKVYEISLTSVKITGVLAHVIAFSGSACATVKKIDPKTENRLIQRHVLTLMHMTCSMLIFTVLSVIFALHKTRHMIQKA